MGDYPEVIPMISYEDPGRAADWLVRAFGFTERMRLTEPDGRVTHVELELGDGVVFLGKPHPDYHSPKRHAEECEAARRWLESPYVVDGVYVRVSDVDDHHRRAREAGGTLLSDPEDASYGDRLYRAADLEGHRWMFAQPIANATG